MQFQWGMMHPTHVQQSICVCAWCWVIISHLDQIHGINGAKPNTGMYMYATYCMPKAKLHHFITNEIFMSYHRGPPQPPQQQQPQQIPKGYTSNNNNSAEYRAECLHMCRGSSHYSQSLQGFQRQPIGSDCVWMDFSRYSL